MDEIINEDSNRFSRVSDITGYDDVSFNFK